MSVRKYTSVLCERYGGVLLLNVVGDTPIVPPWYHHHTTTVKEDRQRNTVAEMERQDQEKCCVCSCNTIVVKEERHMAFTAILSIRTIAIVGDVKLAALLSVQHKYLYLDTSQRAYTPQIRFKSGQ